MGVASNSPVAAQASAIRPEPEVEWACRVDCGSLEDFTARFSGRERGTGGSFSCDSRSHPGEAVRCPLGYLDSERSG